MAVVETIAWVRPEEPIGGLDHLGVQAPCIALYGQLLPGITNVTDRARYYAFYPWIIWEFEKRYQDHSLDEFRRVLRRAECLFALIAIRHARVSTDNDEGLHGKGMVGRDKLLRINEQDGDILLDDYAALDGPKRYFKNKLGGLGQYYFGPLRDLRVVDQSPQGVAYSPGYDRNRGHALAKTFAEGVPGDAFFRALEASSVTWAELDDLAPFCPCALRANPPDHELLLDLFLGRSEAFNSDGGMTRRASLGLMLDLAGRKARNPEYTFEGLLRGAAYSGALADGSAWNVSAKFQRVQHGWGTYQRNELLSLAVQGLFAAVLRAIERDSAGKLLQAAGGGDVAINLLSSLGSNLKRSLNDCVSEIRSGMPPLADWLNPTHEIQRGWYLQGLRLNDDKLEDVAKESVSILLSLLARGVDAYPYADFDLDPEYFDPSEIHLLSFRHVSQNEWSRMSMSDWIRWVAVHWGISRHLRVALRKLRGERRDTFRIRPLDGELRVVEVPQPTYTIPRVGKAEQILRDLGLVDLNDEGSLLLTAHGQQELETCRES